MIGFVERSVHLYFGQIFTVASDDTSVNSVKNKVNCIRSVSGSYFVIVFSIEFLL